MAVYQLENEHILSGDCKSRRRACASGWQENKKRNIYLMEIQSIGSVILQFCFRLSAV